MLAYLGLGSNLGDRRANIDDAVRRLGETRGVTVTKVSSIYETKPVGGREQPDFLNAACEVATELSPRELLREAQRIEREMGRVRTVRWGPRNIDIDILLCGDAVIDEGDLTVPHPRLAAREFVLRPLAEIAPNVTHPVTKREISVMWRDVEGKSTSRRMPSERN